MGIKSSLHNLYNILVGYRKLDLTDEFFTLIYDKNGYKVEPKFTPKKMQDYINNNLKRFFKDETPSNEKGKTFEHYFIHEDDIPKFKKSLGYWINVLENKKEIDKRETSDILKISSDGLKIRYKHYYTLPDLQFIYKKLSEVDNSPSI